MQHLRLFVELVAHAMAAKLAHYRKPMAFGKFLDRVPDIAQAPARPHLNDAVPHRFISNMAKALAGDTLRRIRVFTYDEHAAVVAEPAIVDDGDIDVHDVAFFQRLVVRNAVADDAVDRGAQRLGKGLAAGPHVAEGGGGGALLHHVVGSQAVDFVGRDARFDEGCQVVQDFGTQPSGHAHGGNAFGVVIGDAHPRIIPLRGKVAGRLAAQA